MIPLRLVKRAENPELPLLALKAISELRARFERLERDHIASARGKGASWEDIAADVGVTRQALQQRIKTMERHDESLASIEISDETTSGP